MDQIDPSRLKTVKQICAEINRGRYYVHAAKKAMEAQGIQWPCNQFTTEMFLQWVMVTGFTCTGYGRKPGATLTQ